MGRHFILTHGRSGSNFLVNSLNKHPALVNYGEVLGEWTQPYRFFKLYEKIGKGWADYLDTLYSSDAAFYAAQTISAISRLSGGRRINFKPKTSVKSLGIKDFAFLIDKRGLMNYLRDRENIKIIYLIRRNHFHRYLSLLNLQKTGVVKTNAKLQENNRYTIHIEELLSSIAQFKLEEDIGDQLIKNIPKARVAMIEYENYFSDVHSIEKTHSMIFNFLEVEDIKVTSSQRKILSNDPRYHIVNYEEVIGALRQAGHENYLV